MATEIKSFSDLYLLVKNEVQNNAPELTDFEEGAINDVIAGVIVYACNEVAVYLLSEFRRTYFGTAEGDDLENLAVDHFGDDFARPDAVKATGVVRFYRENADYGECAIPAGTIVKTEVNANGESQSFQTVLDATLDADDLEVNASVEALEAGTKGNVEADEITVIESALGDTSIEVTNALARDDHVGREGGQEDLVDRRAELEEAAGQRRAAGRRQVECLHGWPGGTGRCAGVLERTEQVRLVAQEEDGIAGLQPVLVPRLAQVQPAVAVEDDMEAALRHAGGRGLPGAAVLPEVEQRGLQVQAAEQPVNQSILVGGHGSRRSGGMNGNEGSQRRGVLLGWGRIIFRLVIFLNEYLVASIFLFCINDRHGFT